MLKFFFWLLALVNAALFAYQRGVFDMMIPSGHEPARIGNQLNADKIKLVPAPATAAETPSVAPELAVAPATAPAAAVEADAAGAAAHAAPAAPVAPTPPLAEKKAKPVACAEIGSFSADEAKRFSAQLDALGLGEYATQHPVREIISHIVYIPPQADKDGAEKKAAELRRLGIDDFFIIQDNSSMRWGISLGVFKMEEAARAHLANLNAKGVRTARIGERTVSRTVAFQLRGIDAEKKAALEKLRTGFPKQEMRRCEPAQRAS